ncbi:phylloplanin-like [Quercus lobata]|uniref:Phylloplanin-like n=1 Tax=Quercus lobata TaxID=97700 RepID=A0A7N2N6G2_QUELO|nr:phylloplanin-like [Quercus lobata]
MALKLVLFVTVMVAALALPIAKGTNVVVEVQPSFVPCSLGANVTATPHFPNAQVQLRCGARNVVASTTTNASGVFSFSLDSTQLFLSPTVLLNLCNLVVTTPLSTCNSTLPPVGVLESRIQFIRSSVLGLRIVLTFGPVGFRYSSST